MPTAPDPSEKYIGKRLLVGLTYVDIDDEEKILKREQLFGEIKRYSANDGLTLERSDGKGEFTLPPDLEVLEKADPGRYKLTSGLLIINPDYIATWRLLTTKESIEDLHKDMGNVRRWEKTDVEDNDEIDAEYDEIEYKEYEDDEDEDDDEYDEDDEGYP